MSPLQLARPHSASDQSSWVLPVAGGLALHQAMSWPKPVIAAFGDGTQADLIRDGHNGLVFRIGDVDDLTHRITALLSDPERTRALGQASLRVVRELIDLDRMVASFNIVVNPWIWTPC